MRDHKHPKPAWYKNTYFWISGILFIIGIMGLPFLAGEEAIRDPGQRRESGLVFIYFGGSILMLVNGWLSHRQTVQHYRESLEGEPYREPVEADPYRKPLGGEEG